MTSALNLPRARRGRWMIAASTAMVVAGAGLAVNYLGDSSVPTGTSIVRVAPEGSQMDTKLNAEFTYGWDVLYVAPGRSITIVDVQSQSDQTGLEQVGVMLGGVDRHIAVDQMLREWPPTAHILGTPYPAIGATLTNGPGKHDDIGYELLVGYKLTKPNVVFRHDVVVTYLDGAHLYRQTLPWQLLVCPPISDRACHHAGKGLGAY